LNKGIPLSFSSGICTSYDVARYGIEINKGASAATIYAKSIRKQQSNEYPLVHFSELPEQVRAEIIARNKVA
jgi:hypothetical protein